jgi:hypothetical protein
MHPESTAAKRGRCRVRKQGIARRTTNAFPDPVTESDDEDLPPSGGD